MDFPQERIDSIFREIATNLEKLKKGMEDEQFKKYFTAFDDFFKGTLILKDFLQLCDQIVPQELMKEHEEVRNLLCEIGETKLANKRISRKKLTSEGKTIYRLPDLGDVRARVTLLLALKGFLMENGFGEIIFEAMRFYLVDILLYASQVDVQHDGFINIKTTEPFTIDNLKDCLNKRSEDQNLSEEQRLIAAPALRRLK